MNIVEEAVDQLGKQVLGSGCEDGSVNLRVEPGCMKCQFEHGVCMVATFGGKSAEFVTEEPTRATTRVSFMFGAKLENSRTRAAACAIINAITGFLSINRVLHGCTPESHPSCLQELKEKLNGRKVFLIGFSSRLEMDLRAFLVEGIEDAEVILVNGDGLASDAGGQPIQPQYSGKELLFIGPSTSGVAMLEKITPWCPYGRR